jgi:hypothetical protein
MTTASCSRDKGSLNNTVIERNLHVFYRAQHFRKTSAQTLQAGNAVTDFVLATYTVPGFRNGTLIASALAEERNLE